MLMKIAIVPLTLLLFVCTGASAKVARLELLKPPNVGVQPILRSVGAPADEPLAETEDQPPQPEEDQPPAQPEDGQEAEERAAEPVIHLQTNYHANHYLANISIGTPPQQFQVAVHTGSTTLWVLDESVSPDFGYKAGASTSAKLLNVPEFFDNSADTVFKGKTYTDALEVAGLTFPNQSFGAIERIEEETVRFAASGLLGLGWAFDLVGDRQKDEMPVVNLLSQLDQPLYTVFLGGHPAASEPARGLVTFGALDGQNCEIASIGYVPATKSDYWLSTFQIDAVSVGSFKTEAGKTATGILDSGSPFIHAENHAHYAFYKAVNADFDESLALYTVACDRKSALPTWRFTIGGREYAVEPEEYLLDLGIAGGKCGLAVQHYPSEIFGWTLGTPFMRSWCTVFDVGANRFGFAKARQQQQQQVATN